jgi:hypothetical protein
MVGIGKEKNVIGANSRDTNGELVLTRAVAANLLIPPQKAGALRGYRKNTSAKSQIWIFPDLRPAAGAQ